MNWTEAQVNQAGKSFSLAPPKPPLEREEQKAAIDWLRLRGWRCHRLLTGVWASLNGQYKVATNEAGCPDWVCVHAQYGAVYLEMKRERGSKWQQLQRPWIDIATKDGLRVIVARGAQDAVRKFTELMA